MWRLEKGLCFPLKSYGASHSIGVEIDMVIDIKGSCGMEEAEWFGEGGREETEKKEKEVQDSERHRREKKGKAG